MSMIYHYIVTDEYTEYRPVHMISSEGTELDWMFSHPTLKTSWFPLPTIRVQSQHISRGHFRVIRTSGWTSKWHYYWSQWVSRVCNIPGCLKISLLIQNNYSMKLWWSVQKMVICFVLHNHFMKKCDNSTIEISKRYVQQSQVCRYRISMWMPINNYH